MFYPPSNIPYREVNFDAVRGSILLAVRHQETILEKHYTVDPWFIVHQCRPWVDRMFDENVGIRRVK
ncbi:MAG: hypothetical protein AB1798_13595 [Spirochaetota bacterium]